MDRTKIVANELLKIKAVFLRPNKPFTWASGIKSPIYCDNRIIVSYPNTRKIIEKELAQFIVEQFEGVKCLVGTATAGISHAAYASQILNLPMAYVRNKIKDHGRKQHVEGYINKKWPIVVVEDLISTGQSSIDNVLILKNEGFNVLGVVSIFNYETTKAISNFRSHNIKYASLTNLNQLLDVALKNKEINKQQYDSIISFRDALK